MKFWEAVWYYLLRGAKVFLSFAVIGGLIYWGVFIVRPSTPPNEAALFTIVPLIIIYLMGRMILAGAEEPNKAIEVRDGKAIKDGTIKSLPSGLVGIAAIALISVFALMITVPSMYIYGLLGLHWARDFAADATKWIVRVVSFCAGVTILFVFKNDLKRAGDEIAYFLRTTLHSDMRPPFRLTGPR